MYDELDELVVGTLKKCSTKFVYIDRHPVHNLYYCFDVVVSRDWNISDNISVFTSQNVLQEI